MECNDYHLSLGNILISLRETLNVLLDGTVVTQELDVGTIDLDTTFLAETDVFIAAQRGEAPVLGDDDLLATGELVHGAAEGLDGEVTVGVTGADGEEDLANVHASNGAVGLTEGTTHTGLETIGSGTGQHLVDTDDVVWVCSHSHVETFLSGNLDQVLVGANTGGFERLGAQLFIFVGDEVNAEWELVNVGSLSAQVEDSNLWVWHTTVESGLWVWLETAVSMISSLSRMISRQNA